jgi:iron complex outermembrane recepter protein
MGDPALRSPNVSSGAQANGKKDTRRVQGSGRLTAASPNNTQTYGIVGRVLDAALRVRARSGVTIRKSAMQETTAAKRLREDHMKAYFLLAVSVLALTPTMAFAQSAEPAGAANEEQATDREIIVTASKRSERLQDVPSAITAVGSELIENLGVQSFKDYQSLVPGLSQLDRGAPGVGNIIIRGLNTGATDVRATTAYYLDEAQFTASGFVTLSSYITPDPELGDVERIEVLKGPQGTLYGASSLGGLVRVISQKPDASRISANGTGEVNFVDGGGTGGSLRGSVNLPIVDGKLAVRASGTYRWLPGYADNIGTGRKNANNGESYGARVAVRYTPTDNFTLDVFGVLQNINTNGFALQETQTDMLTPVFGERVYNTFFDDGADSKYRVVSGTATLDLGKVSLIASSSFAKYDVEFRQDQTPAYGGLLAAFLPPNSGVAGIATPTSEKWTSELRLVTERIGAFELIGGVYYTKENTLYDVSFEGRSQLTNQLLPAPLSNIVRATTDGNYEEVAGFGNLTFYLTDSLDVTGGIRYAHNKQVISGTSSGLLLGFVSSGYVSRFNDSVATYLGTLRYRPTKDLSFFLRAASGYRPGGPQTQIGILPPGAQTEVRADTVWNYEAGFRGNFLDGAVDLGASVYRIDWTDVQLNTLVGGITLQGNGGKAKIDGFEIEATVRPSSSLTFAANVGYTNARLTQIGVAESVSLGARAGDKLPLTPAWTVALLADQNFVIGGSAEASLGATLRFQSDMPSSFGGSLLNTNIKIPDQTAIDLRGSVKFGQFRVFARVDNLLNALNYSNAITNRLFPGQPIPTIATVNRPRTFSIGAGFSF